MNICSADNGAFIQHFTSEASPSRSPATNILNDQREMIWMSSEGMPQSITISLKKVRQRPKEIRCIGFYLWHDYETNPKIIELQVRDSRSNNDDFIQWKTIRLERRIGTQLYNVDPIMKKFDTIKLIIKETYGENQTYLNQVMLYEEMPNQEQRVSRPAVKSWTRRELGNAIMEVSSSIHDVDESQPLDQMDLQELPIPQRPVSHTTYQQKTLSTPGDHSRHSRRTPESRELQSMALMSNNMLAIEQNMETMSKRMEAMYQRLAAIEESQRHMEQRVEQRLWKKMEKYVDDRLKEKSVGDAAFRGKQVQKLMQELSQKLLLRQKKLSKLKNSR